MKPERNRTRIIRIYKIEELLMTTSQGKSIIEICNHFHVNRRTIYRDILLMEELGIPLRKEEGRFTIIGTYKIPSYRTNIIAAVKGGDAL